MACDRLRMGQASQWQISHGTESRATDQVGSMGQGAERAAGVGLILWHICQKRVGPSHLGAIFTTLLAFVALSGCN